MRSRRKIPDRRRATQRKVVRPNGRQPERESARRRSRSLHLASDVADDAIETASLDAVVSAAQPLAPARDDASVRGMSMAHAFRLGVAAGSVLAFLESL
jgi:hypothetical protein